MSPTEADVTYACSWSNVAYCTCLDDSTDMYIAVTRTVSAAMVLTTMNNALPHGDRYFLNACFIFDYLQCISRSAFLRRRYSHAERRRRTIHYSPLLQKVLLPKGDY